MGPTTFRQLRVINTDYSVEFGRASAGIVNIITRGGTNEWHGIAYEYFRNNKLDAINLLQATGAHVLRQNQFGAAIGGPIQKDKTFIYGNVELQRRGESPFYNSAVLQNIKFINEVKAVYGLTPEPALGSVLRTNDSDNGFLRVDHSFSQKETMFVRYFINDGRLLNQSPLNDGFDLPSAFKDNFYRDQSVAGTLASILKPSMVNELRVQFARRSFDFPTVSTQPHLELSNANPASNWSTISRSHVTVILSALGETPITFAPLNLFHFSIPLKPTSPISALFWGTTASTEQTAFLPWGIPEALVRLAASTRT